MTHTTRLAVPNGILFVMDPTNLTAVIPEYDPGSLVASNRTCLSVCTQAEADGETLISLGSHPLPPNRLTKRAAGKISCPGGVLAVVTSHFERVVELKVSQAQVAIGVWSDEPHSPTTIAIEVEESEAE